MRRSRLVPGIATVLALALWMGPAATAGTFFDLSISKTDGVTSVTSGATTTYVVTVSNAGPSAASTSVTDPAAPGLSKNSVSCVATAGASCPSSVTPAQLEAGIPVTLGSGSQITLTIPTTVTASGGSVTNTATNGSPIGDIDDSNDSAQDQNTVIPKTGLEIGDVTQAEGTKRRGGLTTFAFTVSRLRDVSGTSSVKVKVVAGTAELRKDVKQIKKDRRKVRFKSGQVTRTVKVKVVADKNVEPDEMFTVVLFGPRRAAIEDGSGLGTIQNDD
jgi:uncharacterized repeat protein (TIGR01451 family)